MPQTSKIHAAEILTKILLVTTKFFLSLLLCLIACGCTRHCSVTPQCLSSPERCLVRPLPPAFPAISSEEAKEDWGKEMKIAFIFGKEGDYYRAITGFRRALILMPEMGERDRRLDAHYGIVLCYYLGRKYEEAIATFNESPLSTDLTPTHPLYEDLLVLLYDCYVKMGNENAASQLLPYIERTSPPIAEKLSLSKEIQKGRLDLACEHPVAPAYFSPLCASYTKECKSPKKAGVLNALLPGAGYLYVGQKNTAATSFLLNALFIAAAYQLFHHKHVALGVIATSLETGWYIGGINGASIAAEEFNACHYQNYAEKALTQEQLYPVLMLKYCF